MSVRGVRPASAFLRTPAPSEERRQGELAPLPPWLPERGALRDPLLLALLAKEIARGYCEVGASVLAEARRKALGSSRAVPSP